MPEWLSILVNVVFGLPIATAVVVVARETLRAAIAPIFGFRVFEIQWGAGERLVERPIGPVDLALAPLPFAGLTVARSGSPRRHRFTRVALAAAPLLAQIAWLLGRLVAGMPPGSAPLYSGVAPLACVDLANALLLVGHATLAIELPGGVRTDVRLGLDAMLGRADSDRAARANHYARLARHRLERADVAGAVAAVDQGRTQLGPEPLLVACRERLDAGELDSVVDQGDCADALRQLIVAAEPRRQVERARWSRGERLRQAFFSAVPLTAALLALGFVQAERLVASVEHGLLALGDAAAEAGHVERCEGMITRWADWSESIDGWLPPGASTRSDRHLALARLERCRGDLDAASGHQAEALLAATAACRAPTSGLFADPERWLENELRVARLFRHAAEVERDRRAFRRALASLTRAEQRLVTLGTQLDFLGDGKTRDWAEATLRTHRDEVASLRDEVLADLSGS